MTPAPAKASGPKILREVRYNLSTMLEEVAQERMTGAFGTEKLRQADVRKLFRAKSKTDRGNRR